MTMIHDAGTDVQANHELPPCPQWCELPLKHDPYTPGNGRHHIRTFGAVTVEQYETGDREWPVAIGIDHWVDMIQDVGRPGTLSLEEAAELLADLPAAIAFLRAPHTPPPAPLDGCPVIDGVTA